MRRAQPTEIGVIVGVAVNFLKPMSFLTPTKRPGEKCGLAHGAG